MAANLLRRICDENDMLLIFDEVQSGMGVTGKNWCCQHFDVLPDLLVFGKKAQVCGVMAGPRLDEVKDNVFRLPSRINSTWGGNFAISSAPPIFADHRTGKTGRERPRARRALAGGTAEWPRNIRP
jgi:4-aminobutyrate aminotransferase-like enzyme